MSGSGAQRGIAILGSTGSIGRSTLDVLRRQQDHFRIIALAAGRNRDEFAAQVAEWMPSYAGLAGVANDARWPSGPEVLVEAATHPNVDIVVNAVVGAVGLDATLAALRAGKRVALANKETLVVAGELVTNLTRSGGGEIVPVDSEHSAILQCLTGRPRAEVRRLILTASGGPFRDWSSHQMQQATLADALRHPTWRMGRKITVDSATLANKALEVIEAHFLFGIPYDAIDVVVHPQSVIHSMVEFVDGSVLAQVGVPSMELPVLYALTHPERIEEPALSPFDPVAASPLTFERVRVDDFPALRLGIAAGRTGGAAPAVFNAANEQAVALFLDGSLSFVDSPRAIASALARLGAVPGPTRDELLEADAAARQHVGSLFGS